MAISLQDLFSGRFIKDLFTNGNDKEKEEYVNFWDELDQGAQPPKNKLTVEPNPDVDVEAFPELEGSFRLRFGPNKDDYLIAKVNGNEEDALQLADAISHAMEDEETFRKVAQTPLEKRPHMLLVGEGNCGGYCSPGNPGEIALKSDLGRGYYAGSVFVHEYHHHEQHMDAAENGYPDGDKRLSLFEDSVEKRLCESTASTAEAAYLYRMKDKTPRLYAKCAKDSPELAAYAKALENGKDKETAVIEAMLAYSTNLGMARYYADWYQGHTRSLQYMISQADRRRNGTSEMKTLAAQEREELRQEIDSDEKLDYEKALKHHAGSLLETGKGHKKALDAVRSPKFSFVTGSVGVTIKQIAGLLKEHGELRNKDVLDNVTVFTSLGRFSLGNVSLLKGPAKLMFEMKTGLKGMFEIPPRKRYCQAYFSDDGHKQYISVSGEMGEDAHGVVLFEPVAGQGQLEDPKADAAAFDKVRRIMSVLARDETLKRDLQAFGKDKPLTLCFSSDIKTSSVSSDNTRISINPNLSDFEAAVQFVKSLHKVKQAETAKEYANGDINLYRSQKFILRNPQQRLTENRLCDAAAEAAAARFVAKNEYLMSLQDAVRYVANPSVRMFKRAMKKHGDEGTAFVATMEYVASKDKTRIIENNHVEAFQRIIRNFDKPNKALAFKDMTKAEALKATYSQTVAPHQIARIACAGVGGKEVENYVAETTLKKPLANVTSEVLQKDLDRINVLRTEMLDKEVQKTLEGKTPAEMAQIVNKIAFRASKSNQSDSYYKPAQKEAEAAKRTQQAALNALKEQGIDRRSVRAKKAYAEAVAAYTKTPEGRADAVTLQSAMQRMQKFETPEAQDLAQTAKAMREAATATRETEEAMRATAGGFTPLNVNDSENTQEASAGNQESGKQGAQASVSDVFVNGQAAEDAVKPEELLPKREVTYRKDPDVENGYILQYGDRPDQIFHAEVEKEKDVKKLAKVLSHCIEDSVTLDAFDSVPPEKRPILGRRNTGNAGAICAPGDPGEIVMGTTTGTGYSAASIFVHEFHHHKQHLHLNEFNQYGLGLAKGEMLERRLCEATASTAEAAYLYRMKKRAPVTYATSWGMSATLRAYAGEMNKSGDKDKAAVAAIKGYSSDLGTARFYENWYVQFEKQAVRKQVLKLKQAEAHGTKGYQDLLKRQSSFVKGCLAPEQEPDVRAILHHHARDLISGKYLDKAAEEMSKPEVNYVTSGVGRMLLGNKEEIIKNGWMSKEEFDKINVRTALGTFSMQSLGKAKIFGKELLKADSRIWGGLMNFTDLLSEPSTLMERMKENASYKIASIKRSLGMDEPKAPLATTFRFSKEEKVAILADDKTKASVHIDFSKSNNGHDKAREMFNILMAYPLTKKFLMTGEAGEKPVFEFNRQTVCKGRAAPHKITINTNLSPYEMAAQCVKQIQAYNQIQKGAEFANGDVWAYRAEANYMRDTGQMIQEKRLCDAASEAAMAEFMFHTKDMMSAADKLKAMNNPALKAYEKGMKDHKNRSAAISKAIEAEIKAGKDPMPDKYFDYATRNISESFKQGRSFNSSLDHLGKGELVDQMFTKKITESQMAAIACAGLLNEEQQKYTLQKTMKDSSFTAFSREQIDSMILVEQRRKSIAKEIVKDANARAKPSPARPSSLKRAPIKASLAAKLMQISGNDGK